MGKQLKLSKWIETRNKIRFGVIRVIKVDKHCIKLSYACYRTEYEFTDMIERYMIMHNMPLPKEGLRRINNDIFDAAFYECLDLPKRRNTIKAVFKWEDLDAEDIMALMKDTELNTYAYNAISYKGLEKASK